MKTIAVLLSGRGSNFLALSDAIETGKIKARIGLVISNHPQALGLQHAQQRQYEARCISPLGKARESYDRLLVKELRQAGVEIVCLAGFMRLLGPYFVRRYPQAILNIHPSLLPAFPGLHAQEQALEWGAKVSGCTVHFVDEELDHGPIILQRSVPVMKDDTAEMLSARILVQEHQIYPQALKLVCEGCLQVEGRRVIFL